MIFVNIEMKELMDRQAENDPSRYEPAEIEQAFWLDPAERLLRKKIRQSFWPVPWSNKVRHPHAPDHLSLEEANYLTYSINHIVDEYKPNFDRAVDTGWIKEGTSLKDVPYRFDKLSDNQKAQLVEVIKTGARPDGQPLSPEEALHIQLAMKVAVFEDLTQRSLFDSQNMRMMRNNRENMLHLVDPSDPIAYWAREGLAAPEEVLDVLARNPKLVSVEIAKKSHALCYRDADPMNEYVDRVLEERSMLIDDDNLVRYKVKLIDNEIPAAVVEQKKIVGYREVGGEPLVVARRMRLLVRGDKDAAGLDSYLDRDIRYCFRKAQGIKSVDAGRASYDREDALFSKIHHSLPMASDDNPDFRWLQPVSTSHYAYFPNRVMPKPDQEG